MQSSVDVSTAVCEFRGIKRAASPTFPCLNSSTEHQQSLAQHEFSCHNDQVCYYKRPRIFDQHPSILSQKKTPTPIAFPTATNPLLWPEYRSREMKMDQESHTNYKASNPEDLTSNFVTKTDLPFASTHHNKPGIEPRRPGEYYKIQSHTFFTKASINTPMGVIQLERVLVDGSCPFNLVPGSIAANLDLTLYSGKTLSITIAQHLIQIKQYSQFTIQIAGHNTTITTGVVSGLQTILLGREWVRSVHLLSDIDNRNYYIPTLVAAEVTKENFPDILDTRIEAKDDKSVEKVMYEERVGENDVNEFHKPYCGGDDHSSLGHKLPNDGSYSKREPQFDGQNLLDIGNPCNEPQLGGGNLSDTRPPSDEDDGYGTGDDDDEEVVDDDDVTEGEDQDEEVSGDGDVSEDEDEEFSDDEDFSEGDNDEEVDDDGSESGEDYKYFEGEVCDDPKEFKECEGWEECDGFAECEICEECDGNEEYEEPREREENSHDTLMEQHKSIINAEHSKERQESEPKGEQAFPSSQQIIMHEGSAILNTTTRLEANNVQNSIAERQSKLTANILNHMSRTQAGQSFKAPVEQLWPDLAGAYAAKVPNPIDLDTIQANLKNNLYSSMDDIRADINLLHQNSADFNGINHTITSTALEVRNTILDALEDIEAGKSGMALRASSRITEV